MLALRNKALLLAGCGSCAMAVMHFVLPKAYGWEQYRELVPRNEAVVLMAVNFGFSFLLLWGGCLTILAARRKLLTGFNYLVLYALATLWAIYVLYQVRIPPPVPSPLRTMLVVMACIITALYVVFLFSRTNRSRTEQDQS